ncbi:MULTISPECIES: protein-disulfide reductase DsbD family protein [Thiorhodovibrio]|uniref:protein-disulfide reductase DsbD family protein n=1 Tax=Thiorhodovibrio TaxID=61593 RepID=UPI0019119E14|nr:MULTISPECIES: protein-disulfide reductase DsbD domain-containing protein [Thiorhodovibrio]MBK5968442.1 protein-disulfide reductase [Thiorhodovibrio winogradskyi]WPL11082.1 Thiol:disulfide interchange protein DsbD precursor [Thiorhodovibrio litoralis]
MTVFDKGWTLSGWRRTAFWVRRGLPFWLLILFWFITAAAVAAASDAEFPEASDAEVVTDHLTARLIPEFQHVMPGDRVDLLLVFDLQPGWHTYWRNPGDSGEPPRLTWTLPDGVRAGPIRWPYPERIPVGPLANYGYSEQALHLIALHIDPDWPAGQPIPILLDANWLVCAEHCIPESGRFALTLTAQLGASGGGAVSGDAEGLGDAEANALFAQARAAVPQPFGAPVLLDRDGSPLRLRLPWAKLSGQPIEPNEPIEPVESNQSNQSVQLKQPDAIKQLEFFADEWGMIEHAAAQTWQLRGDWLELALSPGATPASVAPSGVLVATTADGVRAWELSATPQSLPPLAASADAIPGAMPKAGQHSGPDATLGLPLALLFAFLGGLALNLMPCVFPVLAIKLMGLAEQRGLALAARAWHGLMYSSGVLVFFGLLGGGLLGLRAAGAAVGWGFQLQSPVFVALMAGLFLVLGLSLSGALTLGSGLMGLGAGGRLLNAGPNTGPPDRVRLDRAALAAFGTGALAALVAAPCTAPFMGAAIGYALTQPWFAALAVILTLGLGMAFPFALLSLFPAWTRRLPRPGPWMERLKQLLAFPLFATTAWLLWVLTQQTGPNGLAQTLISLLVLAFGLWLLDVVRQDGHRWQRPARLGLRLLGFASLLMAIVLAAQLGTLIDADTSTSAGDGRQQAIQQATQQAQAQGVLPSMPYSAATLDAALAEGRSVFVNMTAAWCITCLVNERVALTSDRVAQAFAERDVLYLKGDWTNHDSDISAYLSDFGRDGVPLYVYYPLGAEPQVLPQLLTPGLVLEALETPGGGSN